MYKWRKLQITKRHALRFTCHVDTPSKYILMFAETNMKEYFLRPSLLIPENMREVTHRVNDQQ